MAPSALANWVVGAEVGAIGALGPVGATGCDSNAAGGAPNVGAPNVVAGAPNGIVGDIGASGPYGVYGVNAFAHEKYGLYAPPNPGPNP